MFITNVKIEGMNEFFKIDKTQLKTLKNALKIYKKKSKNIK